MGLGAPPRPFGISGGAVNPSRGRTTMSEPTTKTIIGPADVGRRMSLDEILHAEGEGGAAL